MTETEAVPTCQFGGLCEREAHFRMTRTDATGTRTMLSCLTHADPMTESMAQYVSGWGDVTFTVARLVVPK